MFSKKRTIFLIFIFCLLFSSCQKVSSREDCCQQDLEDVVHLFLRTYQPQQVNSLLEKSTPLFRQISPQISLNTIEIIFRHLVRDSIFYRMPYQETLSLRVPLDEGWEVSVKIFNEQNEVIYLGNKVGVAIQVNQNTLVVDCFPQFASLQSHFVVDQSQEIITNGVMRLFQNQDTIFLPLNLIGIVGSFDAEYIPAGNWNIEVLLYEENNQLVLSGNGVVQLSVGESQNFILTLTPEQTSLGLGVSFEQTPRLDVSIVYAHTTLRTPVEKDLIISQFFPDPELGEDYEWIRLVNTSIDSLDLGSCIITKSRNSNAASTRFQFDVNQIIFPGQSLVLGRDSVIFRDVAYDLRLTNTQQELLVLCEDQLIDSLSYSSSVEVNKIHAPEHSAVVKDTRLLREINQASDWCVLSNFDLREDPLFLCNSI